MGKGREGRGMITGCEENPRFQKILLDITFVLSSLLPRPRGEIDHKKGYKERQNRNDDNDNKKTNSKKRGWITRERMRVTDKDRYINTGI